MKDILTIAVDTDKPVAERIRAFVEQIGNPYSFMVGDTPVKVSFAKSGSTIQKSLGTLLINGANK